MVSHLQRVLLGRRETDTESAELSAAKITSESTAETHERVIQGVEFHAPHDLKVASDGELPIGLSVLPKTKTHPGKQ